MENAGRSREGAWIEIIQWLYLIFYNILVAPVRERGLKLLSTACRAAEAVVAPVRERGLKYRPAVP